MWQIRRIIKMVLRIKFELIKFKKFLLSYSSVPVTHLICQLKYTKQTNPLSEKQDLEQKY